MHNLVTCFLVRKGLLTVEASRSHSKHITLGKTSLHDWSAHL